jgi:alpha-ketoglutarate-dependent taurine dioxygenase
MTVPSISLADFGDGRVGDALVSRCARELDSLGYFYLRDVPDGFDHQAFIGRFGTLAAQYGGKLIWDLKPEQGMDRLYHSRNTRALVPHTECYEFPGEPPRYLALWCVQPAEGEGGATTLADGYEFVAELSPAEVARLRTSTYTFICSDGLRHQGLDLKSEHPILEPRSDGGLIIRFSYNNTYPMTDPFLREFLERGHRWFSERHFPVTIERNAILMWDNHRMIHSRTAFSDRRRHLRRALLDKRDSARTPAGARSGAARQAEPSKVPI